MEKLEKLIENVTRFIEEEYDKTISTKDDTEDYKDIMEFLLSIVNEDDTPLGTWTSLCGAIGAYYVKYNDIKDIKDKLAFVEDNLVSMANELGL